MDVCAREGCDKPVPARNARHCSWACRVAGVSWQCKSCGLREVRKPSEAKVARCGPCRYYRNGKGNAYAGPGVMANKNRLKRIMFVHGLGTEREARVWLDGFSCGRRAAYSAVQQGRSLKQESVGSEAWERRQRIA